MGAPVNVLPDDWTPRLITISEAARIVAEFPIIPAADRAVGLSLDGMIVPMLRGVAPPTPDLDTRETLHLVRLPDPDGLRLLVRVSVDGAPEVRWAIDAAAWAFAHAIAQSGGYAVAIDREGRQAVHVQADRARWAMAAHVLAVVSHVDGEAARTGRHPLGVLAELVEEAAGVGAHTRGATA